MARFVQKWLLEKVKDTVLQEETDLQLCGLTDVQEAASMGVRSQRYLVGDKKRYGSQFAKSFVAKWGLPAWMHGRRETDIIHVGTRMFFV